MVAEAVVAAAVAAEAVVVAAVTVAAVVTVMVAAALAVTARVAAAISKCANERFHRHLPCMHCSLVPVGCRQPFSRFNRQLHL